MPTSSELQAIRSELDALKSQNRRLLCVGTVIGLCLAAACLGAIVHPQEESPKRNDVQFGEVKARRIVLLDAASKERVIIEIEKLGNLQGPVIHMKDENGGTCFKVARRGGPTGNYSELWLGDSQQEGFHVFNSKTTCAISIERDGVHYFNAARSLNTGGMMVSNLMGASISASCSEASTGKHSTKGCCTFALASSKPDSDSILLGAGAGNESHVSLFRKDYTERAVHIVSTPDGARMEIAKERRKKDE